MTLKTIIRIGLVVYLLHAIAGHAAYVIKLKNGNEFVTGRYWQDGQQILFDAYGGVFGVDREFIVKIEESKHALNNQVASPRVSRTRNESEETIQISQKEPKRHANEPLASQKTKSNDPILGEFASLKDRFQRIQGMLTKDLRGFMDDLVSFKRRARHSEKVNDYNRQLAEVNIMADEVEALLRSRIQ